MSYRPAFPRRRAAAVLSAATVLVLAPLVWRLPGAGALARPASGAGSGSVTVGDSGEAWYASPAVGACASPGSCPSLAGGPYPAGTLHVAVAVGREAARTYVSPRLSGLPAGYRPVSGTMTLPLATAAGNGNFQTASATVKACLATATFPDGTAGSTAVPPAVDCSVSAPVRVGTAAFTVTLDPFLKAWNGGRPEDGIALLADLSSATVATNWHVTFDGRTAQGGPPVTSSLVVSPTAATAPTPVNPAGAAAGTAGSAGSPGGLAPPEPPAPGAAAEAGAAAGAAAAADGGAAGALPSGPAATGAGLSPAGAAPGGGITSAAGPPPSPAEGQAGGTPSGAGSSGASGPAAFNLSRATGPHRFLYPESMLLPLVLLLGAAFALRLLTSDATPSRRPVLQLTTEREDRS